jgi:Tfp pilus assembly protein PilF
MARVAIAGAACLALALAACAGEKAAAPPATAPAVPAALPPPPTSALQGGVATTSGGQQFAVSDLPSSAELSAERPRMNASAAQAYRAGLKAFQQGDLQGAKTQFSNATEADGQAYQAWYSLGVVRERLGEASGALEAYRRASSILSDYEPAVAAYGIGLARSGRAQEGEEYLTQKSAQMPRSAAVSSALAEIKSIKGDSGAAQRLAQEALKKNPDYRPAMVTLARDHYRSRRLDLALYTLKGILDGFGEENPPRDKNNAEARLIRGLIYKEQGARGLAIDEFKRGLALRPDLVEARVQLATYYMESGNATDAAPLLEGALRYDANHLLARLNLGDAYRLLGKPKQSKDQLEWVARKDPALAEVHYDLGLLFLFSDSMPGLSADQAVDRAIAEFEQYKKMKPRTAAGADDTDELIARAKTKKALKASERAAASQPPPTSQPAAKPAPTSATPQKPAPAQAGAASSGSMPAQAGASGGSKSTGALPPPAAPAPTGSGKSSGALPPPPAPAPTGGGKSTGALPPPPPGGTK